MCETCDDIQKTIQRYRRLQRAIADQLFIDRTGDLIAELQARRAALHPRESIR